MNIATGHGGRRAAHAAWAAVGAVVCLLLVLTGRGGHPPAIILLPLVLAAWAVGHGLIWGTLRLAAAGRHKGVGTEDDQAWPLGLKVALVGTAVVALLGVAQVVGTVLTRSWYPFSRPASGRQCYLCGWSICVTALLLRRRSSRLLSAALAFGWAALMGLQVAQHFQGGSSDTAGLLIAVVLDWCRCCCSRPSSCSSKKGEIFPRRLRMWPPQQEQQHGAQLHGPRRAFNCSHCLSTRRGWDLHTAGRSRRKLPRQGDIS